MQMIRHDTTTDDPVIQALADLAAVTERLLGAVSAADPDQIRMATAGSALAASDRLTAAVVQVLSTVTQRGVIAEEGISVGAWLRTFAARTSGDEKTLMMCVDRLADMPTVREWFFAGELSWPVVRGIVLSLRNLTRDQRRWVDNALSADRDQITRLDPDQVVGAVAALVDQARPDLHRARERRAERDEWLRMQESFDRWVTGQFQFGPESAEIFRQAMAATNPPDTATATAAGDDHRREQDDSHSDGNGDTPNSTARDDAGTADHDLDDAAPHGHGSNDDNGSGEEDLSGYDGWCRHREWTNAKAFIALCRQRLGLPGGSAPSPARPSLLLIADIDTLTGSTDGVGSATAQMLALSPRGPIELTPAAAERLACDATWRIVFTDGDQILGVSAAHPKVSASLRAALVARDGGCRFPACRQPAGLCENHHLIRVSDGGPTTLENLALICSAHHHAIHDSHWANTLHPDGTITFTRRGVTIASAPRAQQRIRPAQPPPTGRPTRTRRTSSGHTTPRAPGDDHQITVDPDPPPGGLPF